MPPATTRVARLPDPAGRVAGAVTAVGRRYAPGLLALVLIGPGVAFATDPPAKDDPKAIEFFEAKVRPVLVENCYQCHSDRAGKSSGGLKLDSRTAIRKGGDGGPAVAPGDPKASLLLTAVTHADPDLKMPPRKPRLPDAVIADLTKWVQTGAADPRVDAAAAVNRPPVDLEAGRKFWAFQKPAAQPLPKTKHPGWARRDLDHRGG